MHDGIIEQDDDGAADAALAALVAERKAAIAAAVQMVLAANGCHRNEKGLFVLTDAAIEAIAAGAVSKILRDSRPEPPIRIS
jgi:hypothetical protein